MKTNYASAVTVVLAVCLFAPSMVSADVSDDFNDYEFSRFPSYGQPPWVFGGDDPNYNPRLPGYDPNLWEPNNPDWTINPYIGDVFAADANAGALRLYVNNSIANISFIGAECADGDVDPNTSTTFFADSAPHYILSYVIVVTPGKGMSGVWIHFNYLTWQSYAYAYEPLDGWMAIGAISGYVTAGGADDHRYWCVVRDAYVGDSNYYDPNRPTDANYIVDPNYYNNDFHPDHPDPNGFWMLSQFDPYGLHQAGGIIDANDPNCHWLRGAWWRSAEEWDGQWHLQFCVAEPAIDPDTHWFPAGTSGFASFGGGDSGAESDIAYDDFEAKWGYYRTSALTLKMKDCCDLTVSPDLLDDPNKDPNDLNELRRFGRGAPIVLDTVVPCGSKVFKKWTVKGPNDSGDPAYQVVVDTNQVLYLTMDGDYWVKATCKCGGGGVEPFAVAVLALLGLGLIIRRLR